MADAPGSEVEASVDDGRREAAGAWVVNVEQCRKTSLSIALMQGLTE